MDAVVFIVICLIYVLTGVQDAPTAEVAADTVVEDTTRVAKLNDTMFDDPDAFMDLAHNLGFGNGGTQ